MANDGPEHDLDNALAQLRKLALNPVQPGESPDWCRTLARAADRAGRALAETMPERAALLAVAVDDAPAIRSRVEQLRADESALQAELQTLVAGIAGQDDEMLASSEHERVLEIREPLLAWVDRARAHVRAVRTVQVEALYRDRGVVD